MLMLGGGGYTTRNVSRCWTYDTAVALDTEIPDELPYSDYSEYFGRDFRLHISPSNMTNQNTHECLEQFKQRLFENLRMLPHAPRVQMQATPEDAIPEESSDEDEEDPDKCISVCSSDRRTACEEGFSDSEEGEGGRKISSNFKKDKRVETEDEKDKGPEEMKEVTEEEKTKEEKPEAEGVKEEVTLA